MVKHIVMWKLKDADKEKNAAKIKSDLEGLTGVVEGLISAKVELNSGASENYDAVLISEFIDFAALERYKIFPAHVKISEFVKSVRTARACVDYEF